MYQYFIATILVLSISCNHSTKESKPITETKTLDTLVQVEKKICKSYVPESIQLFISQNYNGYSIQNVVDDPLCTGEEAVDILIRKKGFSDYSLIFMPNGTFVQQEEDLDLSKAPLKILETLHSNFKGYNSSSQIEKIILSDKTVQYLLDITKGKETKEVIFNVDGSIVCTH
jgi:hypothetical protein